MFLDIPLCTICVIFVLSKNDTFSKTHQVHFCKKRGKNEPSCIVILSLFLVFLPYLRLLFYRASRLRSNLGKNGAETAVVVGNTNVVAEDERACIETKAIAATAIEPWANGADKVRGITIPITNFG